jgi:23S rRNA pseudouridine2605 synthase
LPANSIKKFRHLERSEESLFAFCSATAQKEPMQERLQKIIARAGIASRRHAELLITSGQVSVNGHVVTELGTKADPDKDRIVAAGKPVQSNERQVYLLLNKPPEVVGAMADPEGRKTLRHCLRGLPERVYPVGNLEYAASGLVFLTNDGDLAAKMLKDWDHVDQLYQIKVKGMLTMPDLERLGKEMGAHMKIVRQPDATRGRAANYWYEVSIRAAKMETMRRTLMKERHPIEKLKRIGLGPLSVEGIPRGRYRLLDKKDVEDFRHIKKSPPKNIAPKPSPLKPKL